jgi:hypothetical protein
LKQLISYGHFSTYRQGRSPLPYSHSIVLGGFELMS